LTIEVDDAHVLRGGGPGAFLLLAAVVIAIISWSIMPASCGENRPPCGATSVPTIATVLASIGVAGVVIVLLLLGHGAWRATVAAIVLTTAVYIAWLFAFGFELYELTDERGYRRSVVLPDLTVLNLRPYEGPALCSCA
jgi:purine-cytosine permease-like protein